MNTLIRRWACLALTLLCLTGFAPPRFIPLGVTAYAASSRKAGDVYVVNVRKVNIRSKPNKDSKVVTRLKKGAEVTYQKKEKGWWYVNYTGGNGYVDGKFLKKKEGDSQGILDLSGETKTCKTTRKLRMRSKPSSKGKDMGTLEKGTSVTVLSKKGRWSEISHNERRVWVKTKYLKEE